jgi:cyclopropane fatty-acyl-phospholipid synthase-like methyltransferase
MSERFDAADIRHYYDRHSTVFVRYGQGGGSIHRAVWGEGTRTREEAFRYVDDQIAALVHPFVSSSAETHVVDLGCGVGASLCYLARRLPIRGTGITLSPAQAEMGRLAVARAGLSQRVECLEGDFCDLPATLARADVAYAIESFVHGPDPRRFFQQCRWLLKPRGILVVCDDVRRQDGASPEAARRIDEFARGWHINTLLDRETLVGLARDAGFEHESTMDLTPYLEINRVRDRMIAAGVALLRWLPFDLGRFDYVIGGSALQTCLARGWIGYELTVFKSM